MLILVITLIAVVLCYGYVKLQRHYSFFEQRGIPCKKPTFFLGDMGPVMTKKKSTADLFNEIYNLDSNAKYVGSYQFLRPLIVIRDLELLKSVTIKNIDHFSDRPSFVTEEGNPLFAKNLFSMKAEDGWRNSRNILSPSFTGNKMKTMRKLMIPSAESMVKLLKELCCNDNKKSATIDSKDIFIKYTNDVIATCAFGLHVDSFGDPKNDFYLNGLELVKPRPIKSFLFLSVPFIMKMFRVKFLADKITNFFRNTIGTTMKARKENGITRPDMLQLLMDARDKNNGELKTLDTDEITAQAFLFFLAGFDVVAVQMALMAHEIAINPDVQEKLQEEIDEIVERVNGIENLNYESIGEMQYLDAVFQESMRLHPPVPLLARVCTKEFELPEALPGLKPLHVKPGFTIFIPVEAIHMDPMHYENPEKFDPDRFLGKRSGAMEATNLGFGIGPRMCIGNRFAILETKVLFCYLLSNFNLRPSEKTCIPLKYDRSSFAILPEGGFTIDVEPREKAK